MSKTEEEACLPTYEESTGAQSGHDLLQQTAGARSQRVNQVVISNLLPILSSRASRGLSKAVVALVPTRKDTAGSIDKKTMDPMGLLDSDETVEDVRLTDSIDTEEFWTQPETLRDLQQALSLSLSSNSFYEMETPLPPRANPKSSRSIFSRKKSNAPQTETTKASSVQVIASQEDMCYRVVSDFGLYETITKPAIIVRVNIKS